MKELQHRRLEVVFVVITATLLFYPLYYTISHYNDDAFVGSVNGNVVATTVGVVLGIPIALWISSRQKRLDELSEKWRAKEREKKMLGLLLGELSFNRDHLVADGAGGTAARRVRIGGLKDGIWSALSGSGESRALSPRC